jgi:hypothetical protein
MNTNFRIRSHYKIPMVPPRYRVLGVTNVLPNVVLLGRRNTRHSALAELVWPRQLGELKTCPCAAFGRYPYLLCRPHVHRLVGLDSRKWSRAGIAYLDVGLMDLPILRGKYTRRIILPGFVQISVQACVPDTHWRAECPGVMETSILGKMRKLP